MPPEDMVVAADEAINVFRTKIFPTLTADQKSGIKMLLIWWKGVYLKAGYKQIARFLLNEVIRDL